ncbi:hypothetical protein GCM10027160_07230 [Streptomyces calidiresistens]|uniref:Uncharacterized protein n=1 Tax=Streptomyces calidiresistens TaxID=1485586 RepID=A0A7W3XUZ8_9ACTN|nr:hypothetical protein [Streptomyces calidiresistens]MBB0228440.1 hypothetical protein [Streptomyces calidiresistens]
MTLTGSGSVFARIDRNVLGLPGGTRPPLMVQVDSRAVLLSPQESRKALYGPRRDAALGAAVWRQAVTDARQEPRDGDGTGRLFVVWLALPGLYRNLYRILRLWRQVDRADLEAEAVLAVLTALDTADPTGPDTGGRLIKEAVNRMWAYAKRVTREIPILDIHALAETRNATISPEERPRPPEGWEVHITPPFRRECLYATLRFAERGPRRGRPRTESRLPNLVFRARRHEEAHIIGTLALCPAGALR